MRQKCNEQIPSYNPSPIKQSDIKPKKRMRDYPVYIKPPEPVTVTKDDLLPKAQVKWKLVLLMTSFSVVVIGLVTDVIG